MNDERLIDRVDKRIAELGMTDRQVSLLVTGKPDLIRDMRRKGSKPRGDVLVDLAEALETTSEYLLYGNQTGRVIMDRRTGYDAGDPGNPLAKPLERSLPVYGSALGADVDADAEHLGIEAHIVEMTEPIDWLRRPPLLDGRRDVYAVYITGSSMEPRYEPGDPVIVDPKRPPGPGDDVIVQLLGDHGAVASALIKRLVRRTANRVELQQYNPAMTFSVPVERIAAIHRVLMMRDVLG